MISACYSPVFFCVSSMRSIHDCFGASWKPFAGLPADWRVGLIVVDVLREVRLRKGEKLLSARLVIILPRVRGNQLP